VSRVPNHLKQGEPPPVTGTYQEHNVFGTPTGKRVGVDAGERPASEIGGLVRLPKYKFLGGVEINH
jgi:hypothetical protein